MKKPPITVDKDLRRPDTLNGRPRDDANWLAKSKHGKASAVTKKKPITLPKLKFMGDE